MMEVFKLRLKKVASLSNCPVCGSGVLRVIAPGRYARAYFDCGSVFATPDCQEIKAEIGCPNPTVVAAKALNDEVSAELGKLKTGEAA